MHRIHRQASRRLALLAPLWIAAPAAAQPIYSGTLQPGWTDKSWAVHRLSQTEITYKGHATASVDFVKSGGFYLRHDPFQPAPNSALSLTIYGGQFAGQEFGIHAIRGDKSSSDLPSLRVAELVPGGKIPPDAWIQIQVPLEKLGVADAADLTGFWLQDSVFTQQPTLYIADIALVPAGTPLAPPQHFVPSPPPPAPKFPVSITVDATPRGRKVEPAMFGMNLSVNEKDSPRPQFVALLKKAGIRSLRFPGGSFSDKYDWSTGLDQKGQKFLNNTPQFAAMIEAAGVSGQDVFFTLNYGSGSPQMAAAWVAYANAAPENGTSIGPDPAGRDWKTAGYWASLRASKPLEKDDGLNVLRASHPKPFGIGHWEIGNECYGSWEYDQHLIKQDPLTYARFAADSIALIKRIDPTVKLGVVLCQDPEDAASKEDEVLNPLTGKTSRGWTTVVLTTLAKMNVLPDEGIIHWYPYGSKGEDDVKLLDAPQHKWNNWSVIAGRLRPLIDALYGPERGAKLVIVCTECNSVSDLPGKQSVSIVNALFCADVFGTALRSELRGLTWFSAHGGVQPWWNSPPTLFGWRLYGDYGMLATRDPNNPSYQPPGSKPETPYPTYFAFKLLSHFARPGDDVVSATSNSETVTAYACHRPGHLTVLLVNKHRDAPAEATLEFSNAVPRDAIERWYYGKAEDRAQFFGQPIDLRHNSLRPNGGKLTLLLPPYSITVLDCPTP